MSKNSTNGKVNKSAAIREEYRLNPSMRVDEVIEALRVKGVAVSPNLVYSVKSSPAPKKAGEQAALEASRPIQDVVGAVVRVKAIAADLGGLRELQALIDALVA